MFGRTLIFTALAVYALTLGCVMWPRGGNGGEPGLQSGTTSAVHVAGGGALAGSRLELPYRGAAIQIQRVDWIDRYKHSVDEIADLGLDTVSLIVDSRQENGKSARIWLDMRMTPTPQQLGELIQHAKSRGLRVILMPIVLLDNPIGNEWRGQINPTTDNGGWEEWFHSYRAVLGHFAWIAQINGVDVLSVGSELVSAENKTDEWERTIRMVRKTFKGKLTYSSNWDHYRAVEFWDQLDLIGMNSYWALDNGRKDKATVEDMKSDWQQIKSDLIPFVESQGKPLVFLEVGWCSLANAAHESWDYTKSSVRIDLDLQKRLYEAFFESWYGDPHLGGFIVWEWTPEDGGTDDRGYTPENKPAERVLRDWIVKPKWSVQ